MSESKSISDDVRMARVAATAFLGVVLSIGGCAATNNYTDNAAIVAMVEKGADPIAAKCAIRPSDTAPVCALVAARK